VSVVQAFPSALQEVPLLFGAMAEHTPVPGLHEPALLH
jgi:hypothetical protein